ncbi:MAG: CotH kinase family protein, partial [Verrucomicrobiota bacterium]
ASSYHGGEKEDYDAHSHNIGNVIDGDANAWNAMLAISRGGLTDNADYQLMQGNNPDGSNNTNFPNYLDMPNYINYMLVNIYMGMLDWPHHNYYAARKRTPDSTGYKSFCWDSEGAFRVTDVTGVNNGIAEMYDDLRANAEFNLRFADHVQHHMFNNGVLTATPSMQRFSELSAGMEFGVITEQARWGHISHAAWQGRRDTHLNYLTTRTGVTLGFLEGAGLYPPMDAPVFNQQGGVTPMGFSLSMTITNPGSIYYTLDGSDPREYGTGDPVGLLYTNAWPLRWNVKVRARSRHTNGTWSALNEALFTLPGASPLRVTEVMFHAVPSANPAFTGSDFDFIELQNTSTQVIGLVGLQLDGGIDFDFSEGHVASLNPGEFVLVVDNLAAFTNRYPNWMSWAI